MLEELGVFINWMIFGAFIQNPKKTTRWTQVNWLDLWEVHIVISVLLSESSNTFA